MKKQLFKNTIFNISGYIYLLLASFISVPIILSKLGSHGYGLLIFITSLVPLASTLDFGISQALIRKLSLPDQSEDSRIKSWTTGLWVYLFSAIGVSVIFFALMWVMFFTSAALKGFPITDFFIISILISLTIFVNHFSSAFLSLPQANHRFDIYNLRTMIAGTGNTLVTALLVNYLQDIKIIIFVQFIFYSITFLSLIDYAKQIFRENTLKIKYFKTEFREMIGYGLKNFVGNFANQINYQTSKYILGGILSAQAVTIFSIPQTIVMKAAGGISQLTLAIFPLSASLSNKEKFPTLRKISFYAQLIALLLGLIGVAATVLFGKQFLLWWLKDPVVVGFMYPILQIMSYFLALNVLTPLPSLVLNGLNYPQIPSYSAVATTVLNILLIVVLTPKFGPLGAANATLWSSVIMVPIFLFIYELALRDYEKRLG